MDKRTLTAAVLLLSLPGTQAAACCVCDWPKAADTAGPAGECVD